jgi:hypothetical protein
MKKNFTLENHVFPKFSQKKRVPQNSRISPQKKTNEPPIMDLRMMVYHHV